MTELMQALRTLGVIGKVTVRCISKGRIEVHVNGEYFGVWDDTRKTFVD